MDSIFLLDPESRVREAVDRDGQVLRQQKKVVADDDVSVTWEEKSASPRYTVVDPVETAEKLAAAGFDTEIIRFRSPWKTASSTRVPGDVPAEPLNGRAETRPGGRLPAHEQGRQRQASARAPPSAWRA